ncbi:uncharacterized protein LOC131001964 [Salvia miltiorrhiza]|uniref:uncharacterized protein LOC131001964 n=1 Tax=Salvia miltiorrhiza TaxID=226208 RepID=UPI0025AC7F63|nr:uncharacterized protein LOC131001964 [Salvia miltiorrhiza]
MHTLVGYNSCLFSISYKRSATQVGKALLPGEFKVFEIWELDSRIGSWEKHFHVVLNDVEKAVGLKNNILFLEGRGGSDNLCELLVYDLITREMKATGIFDYAGKMKIADYVCPNGSGTSTDMELTSSTDESSSQSSLSAQFSLIRM